MRWSLLLLPLWGPPLARRASAQAEYRNLDAGFPVRIEDATVTERYDLDLDLANARFDALSAGRKRLQFEPRLSYGILPRTEMWLRLPTFYRERAITPRKGLAGIGVGGLYQLTLETLHRPAMGIASEIFIPTGPNALPASYSLKTAFTKSLTPGRLHLNASIASYGTRSVPSNCLPLPGGSACGSSGGVVSLPPFDGPCLLAPVIVGEPAALCNGAQAPPNAASSSAQSVAGKLVTHGHWLLGIGADKTLPLQSVVFVGDVFAERFEGIGRPMDWTAELGSRKQITPRVILVAAFGRHFKGTNDSSFLVLGATFSRALQLFGNRR